LDLFHYAFSSLLRLLFYATVIARQFGYGFGFAAFMMYLIYVADGESKPHITLTGFMVGMMLPGMARWIIQEYLGYGNFFIWVFLATIPGLILSRFFH
jgi:PAT family beta-lactamase induction signal transducer AmpG